ncbi:MAG: GntR family transcriptional regulator, partial [Phycisphaeraceae bacterium]|nr:GntR family transcriptional regulator [Phycisphaeraceae bacterium]
MVIWKQSVTAVSGDPAYQQLARFIKDQVRIGNLKNGDRLPPVRKIAAESGVGLNTACHALSLLAQECVINQTRGKGTFVTDDATQRVAAPVSETNTHRLDGIRVMILGPLAWLTRGDPRPFESLERQLQALGATTRFQTEDEFHPLAQKRYDQLPEMADAIVWFDINGLNDSAEDEQKAQRIWSLGLPTVTTRSLYSRLFDGVNVNWNQGMWQAVKHLAQRGDKKVAFLGLRNAPESPQRFPWVAARLEMFLTACKYFGLQADESDIWFSQVPQVQVTD